jgi:hypothetical protein
LFEAPAEVRRSLNPREPLSRPVSHVTDLASVALSLYPFAEPRAERRAERHPWSAPVGAMAALSYGVVVRWPPAVAHSGTGWWDASLYPLARRRCGRKFALRI